MKISNTTLFNIVFLVSLISFSACSKNKLNSDSCNYKHEKISVYEDVDGKEIKYDAIYCKGKIIEIYKDNKKVAEEDFEKNKRLILKKLLAMHPGKLEFPPVLIHEFPDDSLFQNITISLPDKFVSANIDSIMANIKDIDIKIDLEDIKKNMLLLKENMKNLKFCNEDFYDLCDSTYFDSSKHTWKMLFKKKDPCNIDSLTKEIKKVKIKLNKNKDKIKESQSFIKDLKKELVKDGFLKNETEPFELEFSNEEMLVNGEKVPNDLFLKYKQIHKEKFGSDNIGKIKIKIDNDN